MKISHKLCDRIDGTQFWCFPWFPANFLLCVILRCTVYSVSFRIEISLQITKTHKKKQVLLINIAYFHNNTLCSNHCDIREINKRVTKIDQSLEWRHISRQWMKLSFSSKLLRILYFQNFSGPDVFSKVNKRTWYIYLFKK